MNKSTPRVEKHRAENKLKKRNRREFSVTDSEHKHLKDELTKLRAGN